MLPKEKVEEDEEEQEGEGEEEKDVRRRNKWENYREKGKSLWLPPTTWSLPLHSSDSQYYPFGG